MRLAKRSRGLARRPWTRRYAPRNDGNVRDSSPAAFSARAEGSCGLETARICGPVPASSPPAGRERPVRRRGLLMFDPTTFTGFPHLAEPDRHRGRLSRRLRPAQGPYARRGWTGVFLSTAFATSATGFGFPLQRHAAVAHRRRDLARAGRRSPASRSTPAGSKAPGGASMRSRRCWPSTCWSSSLVAQLFAKVPALRALAPTQSEPPFAIAEGLVLRRLRRADLAGGAALHAAGPVVHA